MVKKRNRRTRKKYKKRGGASDKQLKECNERLEKQGVNNLIKRRKQCIESDGKAGLNTQPIEEPKNSIKDRAKALQEQFGETGMRKTRKALRTTVGSCRAAVDNSGNKYYYNEAGETTKAAPKTEEFNKVCLPEDGIEKTGNTSGDCIGARYKGGEEYWYHPTKKFSTHNKNHPKCLPEEIPKLVVDENPLLPSPVSIEFTKTPTKQSQSENPNAESPVLQETQLPVKKTKRRKRKKRRTAKSYQRAASERNRRKQMKDNKAREAKGNPQSAGRRRTKRKKSRKRRR